MNSLNFIKKLTLLALLASAPIAGGAEFIKILLIDGQNNHKWQQTTPYMKAILENTGRFQVEVATSPPKGEDMSGFNPPLEGVDAIVSNYNGDLWGEGQLLKVMLVEAAGSFPSTRQIMPSPGGWLTIR